MEKKRSHTPAGRMILRNHVPLQAIEEMPERPEESCVPRCASTKGPCAWSCVTILMKSQCCATFLLL